MKRIYSVNDSKVVLGLLSGLKSRITSIMPALYQVITPMLFVAFGLFGVNESAWAYRCAKAIATADPGTGGSVYVGTSKSAGTYQSPSADASNEYWGIGGKTFTFYLYAQKKSGYIFKGWAESNTANSGTTDNPMSLSVSGAILEGNATVTRYAIFARMAANTPAAESTTSFDDTAIFS